MKLCHTCSKKDHFFTLSKLEDMSKDLKGCHFPINKNSKSMKVNHPPKSDIEITVLKSGLRKGTKIFYWAAKPKKVSEAKKIETLKKSYCDNNKNFGCCYVKENGKIVIGEGDKYKDVEEFIQKHQLSNVSLFPFQPESMIRYTLPLADVSLVSLDQGMEDLMIPSKSFYYLAAGSAVVAIANKKSELSDLLGQRACGVLVPPGDPNKLAETLKGLEANPKKVASMKNNARQLAEERFSRDNCTSNFADFLKQSDFL